MWFGIVDGTACFLLFYFARKVNKAFFGFNKNHNQPTGT